MYTYKTHDNSQRRMIKIEIEQKIAAKNLIIIKLLIITYFIVILSNIK